jgi:hypothetical protein
MISHGLAETFNPLLQTAQLEFETKLIVRVISCVSAWCQGSLAGSMVAERMKMRT